MSIVNPDLKDYRPGHNYTVLKYLGSGAWKSAFLGSAQGISGDIALLCYHSGTRADAANDIKPIFRVEPSHRFFEYLAHIYAVFPGDDGRIWIAEELIPNSLKNIAPLNDLTSFARIGRDLSRGLECIHDIKMVHRDIKLDNCGVYRRLEKAKIFDLGSLVSEPGAVSCTILTRPPELLRPQATTYSYPSDVWALGATMFALSTGDYPFVTGAEVEERSLLNETIVFGRNKKERATARRKKNEMNASIARRACRQGAETALRRRVRANFGTQVAELLLDMLQFKPERRIGPSESAQRWDALTRTSLRLTPRDEIGGRWQRFGKILEVALDGELTLTAMQLRRGREEWEQAKAKDKAALKEMPGLDALIAKVGKMVDQRRI